MNPAILELKTLVEKWRKHDADCANVGCVEAAATFSVCADELTAMLALLKKAEEE